MISDRPKAQVSADGQKRGEITASELAAMLELQRESFLRDGPPSLAVRRDRVDRMILLLTDNAEALGEALNADFGHRPDMVSQLSDVVGILPDLALTRARLRAWMRPRSVRGSALMGIGTTVERVPLGTVGIIGPWNFPIGLVAQPAAAALAAGNRVMIKLSEMTPRASALFIEKAAEYFAPEELVAVTGGPAVGSAFSDLPLDHLFFTGSPKVGALVAAAAGRNLVPVTLELGGKNPAVVSPHADVEETADRVMSGRLANGGQVCLCPENVFVPEGSVDRFIAAALKRAQEAYLNDGGTVTIVNDANFQRLLGIIEDARAKGAVIHESFPEKEPDPVRRSIPPIIVTGLTDEMELAHEETFGPILAVHGYQDVSEVIAYVAPRPSPLAAYWFGPKDEAYHRFTRGTRYGGMTVNDFALHCGLMNAPFGGVGHSGSGAYHGKAGFDTFTHERTTTTSRLPIAMGRMMTPPYNRRLEGGINTMKKMLSRPARKRVERSGSLAALASRPSAGSAPVSYLAQEDR